MRALPQRPVPRLRSVVAIALAVAATTTTALAASAGQLDPTFGDGGKVATDLGVGFDGARATAIDSEGRLIVVGKANPPATHNRYANTYGAVARFLPDGSPDPSFGGDGIVAYTHFGGTDQGFEAVTVDAQGRIVAAGYSGLDSGDEDTYARFVFARYLPDGSLDTSFGDNGKKKRFVRTGNTTFNAVRAIAVDSRGRIVAAGTTGGTNRRTAVLRLLSSGDMDDSFGKSGVSLPFRGEGSVHDLVLRPSGKIDLIGAAGDDLALSRLDRHGDRLLSFGRRGTKTFPGVLGDRSVGYSGALDEDRRLLIAGYSYGLRKNQRGYRIVLLRVRPSGELDQSFGTRGVAKPSLRGQNEAATAVQLDSLGRIVVGGYSDAQGRGDFALLRRKRDGTADRSFGTDGHVLTDFAERNDTVTGLELDSAGRIIAGGTAKVDRYRTEIALAGYGR